MRNKASGKFLFLWISICIFLIAVAYRYAFVSIRNTDKINVQRVTSRLNKEIQSIEPGIEILKSKYDNSAVPLFSDLLIEASYPYYIFSNHRVVFWSNNLFTPKYRDILGDFQVSYVETTKGNYIVRKDSFDHQGRRIEIVFMIPLIQRFAVVNEFLKDTYNEKLFTDSNFELIQTSTDPEYLPVSIDDEDLFFVSFGNTYSNSTSNSQYVIIVLLVMSLISIGIFIKIRLDEYVKERNVTLGFVFLLSCIIILRSLMLLTGFPLDFVYIGLFDPIHYGYSLVNPSLGDLLLNLASLLLLGMYVFNNFLKSSSIKKLLKSRKQYQVLVAVGCVFFSFFWLAVHHQTMKTLNFDSQWSMDITQNLEFSYLKIIGFILFFVSVTIYFLFAHVCFRLYIQLIQQNVKRLILTLVIGLFIYIAFSLALQWDFIVVAAVNLLFLLILLFFNLPRYIGKLQFLTFIYFFAFGLPGAIIGLYANYQYNNSTTEFNKSRLANQLLLESDIFTEFQLRDVVHEIQDDIYIKDRIIDPFASKLIIENKIRREYMNNLDKYDIQIFVFNDRGIPFEEFNITENYHDYKSRLREYKIDTLDLYFINKAREQATNRYLYFIEIENRGQIIGYVLLDLTQKRLVPNSVFPSLLNKSIYDQQIDNVEQFSFGVFNNNELQFNYGEFNYRKYMDEFNNYSEAIFDHSIQIQGFNHKAFGDVGTEMIIISAKEPSFGSRFANFSFLFLVYVFSILLILISITSYQSLRKIKLNYATKIQLYLNFAFFAPLIIVSATTVSIIIQTFKTSLEDQYLEFAQNLSAEISGPLNDFRTLVIDIDELSNIIFQVAEIADLDVNVFINGHLRASSLIQIYQNEILSNNIEPRAYIKIEEESESSFIQEEQVGLLKYKNVYIAVRSYETGSLIGILSLPFFTSQRELERNIVEVLSNITNIFTFVFIIFLFISFFVSRGLTFPLRLITQKIKRTTLAAYNEPLSWNSDDEIGLMVTEYNRMLLNLEESKEALAKSEKETAWREMARQVAHEIKNPLTPMKLTLQHMKRVINEGQGNGQNGKKLHQINSLLEQIETLSDIATSFSDFAKMPAPTIERLDLGHLLKETIDLYNKKEFGEIVTNIEQGRFIIEGDRKWLGRAFSNLIINGFQAVTDQKEAKVEVSLFSMDNDMVRVEIRDNGHGIPKHIQDKVFTPNFSTKYTGSGLGLAITRKGVEHANGKIWFHSEEGVGTVFYIEIPRG